MRTPDLEKVLPAVEKIAADWRSPLSGTGRVKTRDPFRILVSCILSLRTKDAVTKTASERLLQIASTPEDIARMEPTFIEQLIYPVGFYRRKAVTLVAIARLLLSSFNGVVPDSIDGLLQLPGVGRKTANIVITEGFAKPGIAVDTHVHRITNRWGYVNTNTPEKTEIALRQKLPRVYWMDFNRLLVAFGQKICRPISPLCTCCPVRCFCERRGVTRSR